MAKLRAEVDYAVASHSVSQPARFDEICKLPYIVACLRESFRFSPSNPLFPRFVADSGLVFGGLTIPPGTKVASSPWITMHDPDMYGQDSDSYRPERRLEVSPEIRREWDIYDFHWGYGNRLCMGKHIAIMEIYKVTLEVFATITLFPHIECGPEWVSFVRIC